MALVDGENSLSPRRICPEHTPMIFLVLIPKQHVNHIHCVPELLERLESVGLCSPLCKSMLFPQGDLASVGFGVSGRPG